MALATASSVGRKVIALLLSTSRFRRPEIHRHISDEAQDRGILHGVLSPARNPLRNGDPMHGCLKSAAFLRIAMITVVAVVAGCGADGATPDSDAGSALDGSADAKPSDSGGSSGPSDSGS